MDEDGEADADADADGVGTLNGEASDWSSKNELSSVINECAAGCVCV